VLGGTVGGKVEAGAGGAGVDVVVVVVAASAVRSTGDSGMNDQWFAARAASAIAPPTTTRAANPRATRVR
jgi:hypothetical protein